MHAWSMGSGRPDGASGADRGRGGTDARRTCVEGGFETGWLIFKTGPSELGVHPTKGTHEGEEYSYPLHQSISLMCDDVTATVGELERRGAEFSGGIEDYGFGLAAMLKLPGAGEILLYQPQHPTAYDL